MGKSSLEERQASEMNRELLMLVDAISREKNVDREVVFGAVELALASATKKVYPEGTDIRVSVDRDSGNYETFRRWLVVPDEAGLQNPEGEEMLTDARDELADIEEGDYIEKPVDSLPIGRIGAQAAKQVILQKIRDAEREMLLTDFLSRGEKIFVGTVKRMDKGDMIVESGRVEGRLRRTDMIPKENLRSGDRVRAMIMSVDSTLRGAPILLSRTAPEYMIELFRRRAPVIQDRAPRSPCSPTTKGLIRSAPAWACVARESMRSRLSWPANGWISCCGVTTRLNL